MRIHVLILMFSLAACATSPPDRSASPPLIDEGRDEPSAFDNVLGGGERATSAKDVEGDEAVQPPAEVVQPTEARPTGPSIPPCSRQDNTLPGRECAVTATAPQSLPPPLITNAMNGRE